MKKKLFFLISLVFISTFGLYVRSLSYFFISDDFYFLSLNSLPEIFIPKNDFYHYIPIFWLSFYLSDIAGSGDPFIFHLLAIFIHCINSMFVFLFTRKITNSVKTSVFTTLLFAAFFSQYEVVFWATGLSISLMVMFSLLSFIAYINYSKTNQKVYAIAYCLFSILAFLTHEYWIGFFIGAVIYQLILGTKRLQAFKLVFIPILSIGLLFILRASFFSSPLAPSLNTPIYIMWYTAKLIAYLSIPNPYIIAKIPNIVLLTIAVAVVIVICKWQRSQKIVRFLSLWIISQVILISITSAPQARYIYFLSIPAMILVAQIMKNKNKAFQFLIYAFISISGIVFINQQSIHWKDSSTITKNTLKKIYASYPTVPKNSTVYAINFPDSLNGPPWNAYLFRNGLDSALQNIYGKKIKVIYYTTSPATLLMRNDGNISKGELAKIVKKANAVFQFNYKTNTIDIVK